MPGYQSTGYIAMCMHRFAMSAVCISQGSARQYCSALTACCSQQQHCWTGSCSGLGACGHGGGGAPGPGCSTCGKCTVPGLQIICPKRLAERQRESMPGMDLTGGTLQDIEEAAARKAMPPASDRWIEHARTGAYM